MAIAAAPSALKRLNVHTRTTFVRAPVREVALTTKIINDIMPFFPKDCMCIAGYLDDANQFWKVNYHYDLLMGQMEKFQAIKSVTPKFKGFAKAIQTLLANNPPNPKTGYKNDPTMGFTKDSSSAELILKRHALVKQAKKDFETVMTKAGVVDATKKKNPPEKDKPWWLSVAPVAVPGTSKHGDGYALDIKGHNANDKITQIVNALGATLAFNEASHVHVEFAKGVKLPA